MCVGETAVHGAKRPHAKEVLFDTLSLLPIGGEKNLEGMSEVAVHRAKRLYVKNVIFDTLSLLPIGGEKNLKGMSEAVVHGAKSLHTRDDNIMSAVNGWIP